MKKNNNRRDFVFKALRVLQDTNSVSIAKGITAGTYSSYDISEKANELMIKTPGCEGFEYFTSKSVGTILSSAYRNKLEKGLQMCRNANVEVEGKRLALYSFRYE